MAAPETKPPAAIQLTCRFAAPRERVFGAWTDPKALGHWFTPGKEYVTRVPQLEAREGGRYRIEMERDGKFYRVNGTYREVRFPDRLVFTWHWETEPDRGDLGETRVTIELHDGGIGTELVLTHEGFPGETEREEHEQGWVGCLGGLEAFLEEAAPKEPLAKP